MGRDAYVNEHMLEDMEMLKDADITMLKSTEHVEGKMAIINEETKVLTPLLPRLFLQMTSTYVFTREEKDHPWVLSHIHWSSSRNPRTQY